MGFHHVGQDGLELLTSGDLPASAFQSAGFTGVSHLVHWLILFLFFIEMGSPYVDQLVLNFWAQVILLPQPSKVLGLQVRATTPDDLMLLSNIKSIPKFSHLSQ